MEVLYQLSYPGETALQSQIYVIKRDRREAPWHSDGTPAEKSAAVPPWNSRCEIAFTGRS
jgi:hypothetical protein